MVEVFARAIFAIISSDKPNLAESRHTQHDPILGWQHIPGKLIKNMYGQGKDLSINSQGFRGLYEYDKKVLPGKTRIICLGDSFTLGFGSGDAETIPYYLGESQQYLSNEFPDNIETINMGQGGYGLDQMFLWYCRERENFEHKVLLLCFIDFDINRMNWPDFFGYAKPWLKRDKDVIQVMNTPVVNKKKGLKASIFVNSGIARAIKKAAHAINQDENAVGVYASQDEMLAAIMAIFSELRQFAADNNIALVIVRLPQVVNLRGEIPLITHLGRQLEQSGFTYFNLVKDSRQFYPDILSKIFIHQSTADPKLLQYAGFEAHYTPFGNKVMAGLILKKLLEQDIIQ